MEVRDEHIILTLDEYNNLLITIKNQQETITNLQTEMAELKARLNSNSQNRSKPPSSDGYQKKPALPKEKQGKQGGQQGHKGRTLQQVESPDKTVVCAPAQWVYNKFPCISIGV